MICLSYIDTPIGPMRIGATDEGICLFDFQNRKSLDNIIKRIETHSGTQFVEKEHPYALQAALQMDEYFKGIRKEFDMPLHLLGTPFQQKVWNGLVKIPYGDTRSYKQQSIFLGDEKAIRAVASANGENGIAIIVPCHRVIGSNGSLVGYGGGLERKKWLLDHEQKHSGKGTQQELFI